MQLELNLAAARARGDRGAERAASKADRAVHGWVDRAAEAVRDFVLHNLAGMTREFTIETVRVRAKDFGLPDPPDARAWGHVTRRAVQLGYIEATGGYAPAASSNGSPKRLYRRGMGA